MLNLATPISQLFDDPALAKAILRYSDCLECRDRSLASRLPKQYLLHLDAEIFHVWPENQKDFIASAISSKTELKLVSFHLGSCYPAAKLVNNVYQPDGDVYSREQLLLTAKKNIDWLRNICGKIEIGVENNNYYPTPAYLYVTDGDFICELVQENGIRFVLDLAHAAITSINRGVDLEQYLSTLPLASMIQLHVCSHGIAIDGLAFDAHEPPDRQVMLRTEELLARFDQIDYLTVEYYKNAERLGAILKQCQGLKRIKAKGN